MKIENLALKKKTGRLFFYTKGAVRLTGEVDKLVNRNFYKGVLPIPLPLVNYESVFKGGEKIWQNLLSNINSFINNNSGISIIQKDSVISNRHSWIQFTK